ncbi:MAG: biopolymer transporter ExbD [Candidatus Dependentiae bacterium]|nr:biopolymer transporter ExbD [Candidatus Dependentiae bacterium]
MAFIRRKRKTPSALHDIPLTPLIDTALTLLIIFMVTTPMMQNAIKVTLPDGQAKEDGGAKQDLIVYIDSHEKLFFNGMPVTKDSLVGAVRQKIGNDTQSTVFVKADQSVRYGHVIQIVDQLKVAGGVRYVALATKKVA